MLLSYFRFHQACQAKQAERAKRIADLPPAYHEPLAQLDKDILNAPITTLVENTRSGEWSATQILRAYGRKALAVHEATNCLTEVMIADAEANLPFKGPTGPLAGVPVSLKDTVSVAGYDACIGYAAWAFKPAMQDSPLVRLLRDAGAVLYVKTAVPITLLSFESYSAVFGRALNPHNTAYSPGGSSGGEAALLAAGGARIGIGTDVAGSVRVPAHYCGVYTVRASVGRFPKSGNMTSMPGQEGVPAVCSPMARTLEDLEAFWRAVVEMKPWVYDHSCIALPWREVDLDGKKLRFGIMWDDGVVPPSPACRRALSMVQKSLQLRGYDVVTFDPPDPVEGLQIASQLLLADAGETATRPILPFEPNDPGIAHAMKWFRLPSLFKTLYIWYVRYIKRDALYASLLAGLRRPKSVPEHWALVAQREAYRARWAERWDEGRLDFLLCVPNALPAVPHGGMKRGFKACGYSFLFNLLDNSAGVLPVTRVDAALDGLSPSVMAQVSELNAVSAGAYEVYDSASMHGLPTGVQLIGRRLEEEKVMTGMHIVQEALKRAGYEYRLLAA